MLHSVRSARLRLLQCLGVFEEPEKSRYGLLHKVPSRAHPSLGPKTLLSYMSSKWKPSLTDRFDLARKLAHSVAELHSEGWLHKNFRSENILFFPQDGS